MRDRLKRYLHSVLPEAHNLRLLDLRRNTEGFSQESFFFEVAFRTGKRPQRRRYVAKRAPAAGLLEPYDLEPEFRVLHALSNDPIPSPPTPWFEANPAVLDRPFYVMEHVSGSVPIPAPYPDGSPPLSETERWALAPQVIAALADLHDIDWRKRGFGFLRHSREPAEVAREELAHWSDRLARSALPLPPIVREALLWLEQTAPIPRKITLVHGDYRLGNWLVEGADAEIRLNAILDWEMVHLGDPLEDLAWCVSPMWRAGTPWAAALVPENEFLGQYERRSGRKVDRSVLHWYGVLSMIKMIAIEMTGIRAFREGRTRDLRMAIFDHQIAFLCIILAVMRGFLPDCVLERT